MESPFDCTFKFELVDYTCKVVFLDTDPFPQFRVTLIDPLLVEKYGATKVFRYEHGHLTWKASPAHFYDGYLKTSIAEGLFICIQKSM